MREPNEIVVCTEYCSKGSLQDVLEDEDFKLDNMFIASLVMDLVKGKWRQCHPFDNNQPFISTR